MDMTSSRFNKRQHKKQSFKWGFLCLFCATLLNVNTCSVQGQSRRPSQPPPPGRSILPLPIPIPPPLFGPIPIPPILPGRVAHPEFPLGIIPAPVISQGDFRVEVTESFLQQLLSREDQTSGAVQDLILGAQVNGQQTTLSNVSINCLSAINGARFNFEIQGTSQTATTASTPQATIAHQGNSRFRATKSVLFDGTKLLTLKATLSVMPDQKVVGVRTRHSRVPLLGPLADQIALGTAIVRTPQSNLIAGQKLIRRLQPQVDQQIEQNLKRANQWLQEKIWNRLEQSNLSPQSRSAFSTNDKLLLDYRFSEKPVNEISPESKAGGIRLLLHEQFFAGLISKHNLAGKQISFNEIIDQSNTLLQMVDQSFIDNPNVLPLELHFTCAESSPLTISFQDNRMELILRGKFQLQNLSETETHRVRLTFTTELNDTQLIIKSEEIDIREEQPDGKLAEPGFTQRAYVTQFETLLRPVHIKRQIVIPLNMANANAITVTAQLKQLTVNKGWLDFSWDATKHNSETNTPTLAEPEAPFKLSPSQPPTPTTSESTKENRPPAKENKLRFPKQTINP